MLKKVVTSVLAFFVCVSPLFAQSKVVVAKGISSIINGDVEQAKKQAVLCAKQNAVEEAYGIEITTLKLLEQGGKNTYQQFIASSSHANVSLVSIDYDINRNSVIATITANVVKTENDTYISVKNVKPKYRPTESISFRLETYKTGYLYVFYLTQEGMGEQLFPIRWENNLIGNYSKMDLYLARSKEYNTDGTSYLFIVLLNEEHPFKEEVTENNVMAWYSNIPISHRNAGVWEIFQTDMTRVIREINHPRLNIINT